MSNKEILRKIEAIRKLTFTIRKRQLKILVQIMWKEGIENLILI